MEALEAGFFDSREGGRIGRVSFGPADMGVRRMHARRKETDDGQSLRLRGRVCWPQAEPLAKVRQNGGVLGQRIAVVEAQGGHAS